MSATPGRTPRQLLILVKVTFTLAGPTYSYLSFTDGHKADDILVATGDQVAWYVKVQTGPGWSTPAYELEFEDPTIFGTDSISVPSGGMSGFFTVVALSTPVPSKYSLAVSGIFPTSDPHIQVNPNGNIIIQTDNQIAVRWTAATNIMEYQVGGPWQPFPDYLSLSIGDKVVFQAVLTPPKDFQIVFPADLNPTLWASPFDVTQNSFQAVDQGPLESTNILPVSDGNDPAGTQFQFVAALADGTAQSDPFTFALA